jgi:hypothetical protein
MQNGLVRGMVFGTLFQAAAVAFWYSLDVVAVIR